MAIVIDGNNTPTAGGIGYGDGTELAFTAAGTSGRPIVSGGAGAPTFRPYTLPAADGSANQFLQTDGAGALSFATASSLAAATQAEMEAASSNTVAATPSNTNFHPGVSKTWLKANGAGTTINASHNVTSITDTGAGRLTVTIATDFSSANYVVVTTAQTSGNAPDGIGSLTTAVAQAAGSVELRAYRIRYVDPPADLFDPESYYMACFGDQA